MPMAGNTRDGYGEAAPSRAAQWRNRGWLGVLGALSLLVSACGDDRPVCLPPVPEETSATRPAEAGPTPGPVHLYLDGSGSMLGFVADSSPSAYRDVLNALPGSLRHASKEMDVFRFAAGIERRIYSDRLAAEILNASFYRSEARSGAGGIGVAASATHLHDVLRKAAAQPNVTSAIVTDLFLSADEVHGSESGPLRQALADILHNGMSVALIGIQAPFTGRIFDLATTPGWIQLTKGLRPFYILLIGTDARVRTLYETLQAEVLGAPLVGSHHLSVFSAHSLPTSGWARRVMLNAGAAEAVLLGKPAASGTATQISVGGRAGGASVTLERQDADSGWFANQVVAPDIERASVKSTLHFYTNDRHGCENGWVEDDERPGMVRLTQGNADRLLFEILEEPAAALGFRPKVTYVLDAAVTVSTLRAVQDAKRWIQGWSYDASQEKGLLDRVAQREKRLRGGRQSPKVGKGSAEAGKSDVSDDGPILFPTLNLASLGDLMMRIIKEKHSPESIHAFRLVFNME